MSIECDRREAEYLEQYREYLDQAFGTVNVAGYEYDTSRALEELDPIAFRTGFNDWLDSQGIDLDAEPEEEDD